MVRVFGGHIGTVEDGLGGLRPCNVTKLVEQFSVAYRCLTRHRILLVVDLGEYFLFDWLTGGVLGNGTSLPFHLD